MTRFVLLAGLLTFAVPSLSAAQVSSVSRPSYNTVLQGGTPLFRRPRLNFSGAGITCSDDPASKWTSCVVGGGGGAATGFQLLAADPAGPAAGDVWFNSGAGKFKLYDGALVIAIGSAAGHDAADFDATGAAAAVAATLGTAATKNTGTAAGQVVVLDGAAKLPPVDGSQLTNLPAGGVAPNSFFWSPVALAQSGMANFVIDNYNRTMGTGWEATLAQTATGYEVYEGAIPLVTTLRIRLWRVLISNGSLVGPWTQMVLDGSGANCAAADSTYCMDVPYHGAGTYTGSFPTTVSIPAYGSFIYVVTVWALDGAGHSGRTEGARNQFFPGYLGGSLPVWGPAALYVPYMFYVDGTDSSTGNPPSTTVSGSFATIRPIITVP